MNSPLDREILALVMFLIVDNRASMQCFTARCVCIGSTEQARFGRGGHDYLTQCSCLTGTKLTNEDERQDSGLLTGRAGKETVLGQFSVSVSFQQNVH